MICLLVYKIVKNTNVSSFFLISFKFLSHADCPSSHFQGPNTPLIGTKLPKLLMNRVIDLNTFRLVHLYIKSLKRIHLYRYNHFLSSINFPILNAFQEYAVLIYLHTLLTKSNTENICKFGQNAWYSGCLSRTKSIF